MPKLRSFIPTALAAVVALAAAFATVAPSAAATGVYRFNAYWASGSGGTFVNQPDSCSCVAASAQAWLNKINGTQYQAASTVWRRFAWARPYTQYICRLYNADGTVARPGVLTSSYGTYVPSAAGYTRYRYSNRNPGLDPRAFAWILYRFTPAGWHFNDYWLNAANDGSQARAQRDLDTSFVKNLRITGRPAAAIIHGGSHAVLVTGFQSDVDPLTANYNLLGFYVWDPLANVLGRNYGTGYLGQTFYFLADWKTNQFTPYHDAQYTKDNPGKYVIWEKDPASGGPSYVAVFQTSSTSTTVYGPPTDNPPNSMGFARWKGGSPIAAALPGAPSGRPATGPAATGFVSGGVSQDLVGRGELLSETLLPAHPAGALDATVADGLARAGFAAGSPVGDLSGVRIGRRLRVASLDPDHTSYWLVSLERRGATVAVATVDETSDGLRLGSVTAADSGYAFPDAAAVRSRLASAGRRAVSVEAAFAASPAPASELAPVWLVTDAAGGRTVVDASGRAVVSALAAASR